MSTFLQQQIETNPETDRIAALHSYKVLDTPLDPSFDNITLLASQLFNAPLAMINFVDENRIWSKSHIGTDVNEYEREKGFCSSVILDEIPYIIYDASADPRSINHPLVTQKSGIRFYAGIPLCVQGKYNLGTLCLKDYKPRSKFSEHELETLKLLAKMAVDVIESHAKNLNINSNNNQFSEQHFRSLFNQTSVGVIMAEAVTGKFVEINQQFSVIVGYSTSELVNLSIFDITHPDDIAVQLLLTQRLCLGEISEYHLQKRYIHKDGSVLWVNLTCTALWKAGEEPTTFIATIQNVNEVKKAELSLIENEKRWSFALDGSNQGVWDLNIITNEIFLSPRCKEMLGYSDEQISTNMTEWLKLIHPDDIPCLISARMQTLDGSVKSFENDHRKLTVDGTWKWIHVKGMVVERDEQHAPTRVIGTYTDVSELKRKEDDVLRLAHYDIITSLPNRTLFLDRLTHELKKSKRSGHSFALMMLDLDRFKQVNDTLGHAKGDLLLKIISERLKNCLRDSDTVARLGGDEFTVIVSEVNDANEIDQLAVKILNVVSEPCLLDGDLAYVTASIGISLYPDDTLDRHELLRQADQAMYAAKRSGKNTYAFFTQTMQKSALEKSNAVSKLKEALIKNEFLLLYQPIIDLQTGEMLKAEALIRWQLSDEVQLQPAFFIPLAEETGQIVEIGEWVIKEAANAIKTCRENIHPDFQISVNKSPVQFHSDTTPHISLFEHLKTLNLPGRSLIVEITEHLLMQKSDNLVDKFRAFKDAGIQLALDDFGTGYSSLPNLKHYAIDYIKIDQVFVKNLIAESDEFVLCETIIMMAHKLNIHVIAEGVETKQQFELLKSIGCDFGQGNYFSVPLKIEDLLNFKTNLISI